VQGGAQKKAVSTSAERIPVRVEVPPGKGELEDLNDDAIVERFGPSPFG
jgi:hypothetical protein